MNMVPSRRSSSRETTLKRFVDSTERHSTVRAPVDRRVTIGSWAATGLFALVGLVSAGVGPTVVSTPAKPMFFLAGYDVLRSCFMIGGSSRALVALAVVGMLLCLLVAATTKGFTEASGVGNTIAFALFLVAVLAIAPLVLATLIVIANLLIWAFGLTACCAAIYGGARLATR